jgi:mycothiol synthase
LITDVYNMLPHDQLEVAEMTVTPDDLRQNEHSLTAKGTERWTAYVLERASGRIIGYSEVLWNANRPMLLVQETTGVLPTYLNRGLGRWLKAAMLDKVLRDRPQVGVVRTSNTNSNTAMGKINHALGFRPYMTGG